MLHIVLCKSSSFIMFFQYFFSSEDKNSEMMKSLPNTFLKVLHFLYYQLAYMKTVVCKGFYKDLLLKFSRLKF
jgi:hypothetical protein